MINRRRFLAITAAFAATPASASPSPVRWRGVALGAEAEIEVHGPPGRARPILDASLALLRDVESLFNLFDPGSALSRLNAAGHIVETDTRFHRLFEAVDRLHAATNGRFDPTVQPLWRALAEGRNPEAARALIGWEKVARRDQTVRLAANQALTFNGIAQGFATDLVTELMRSKGVAKTLVNIGEHGAIGGPWRLGIEDPDHGLVAARTLTDGAMATSSPFALRLGSELGHILDARTHGTPIWSTVSVEADTATLADGLSTALCLADLGEVKSITERLAGVRRITLVARNGDISTV